VNVKAKNASERPSRPDELGVVFDGGDHLAGVPATKNSPNPPNIRVFATKYELF
jgi:hypothetical protein